MDAYEERGGVGEQLTLADRRAPRTCCAPITNAFALRDSLRPTSSNFSRNSSACILPRSIAMDHTPGKPQFRDLDKYFIYYLGKTNNGAAELGDVVRERQLVGERAEGNRPLIVAIARARG